ncbi:amino acid permease family protein [Asticcacaulis biprosthecium C19]|uniref:Amino acid permease family protein n=1 Tax=Asticcacaulis biprosthecium C19 TaxID=715226 RepID=F4QR21_9CAUL|nr:amino acid permease [Asticcacaulis biprosthecium]EGF90658.1 amino acid permease family protein [Asticcacaulis biprosthecium C19]
MNSWRIKSLDAILATAEKKSLHRSLGAFQLTMLGIGAIIGTGIFVLTAAAAQKAGPGMMFSFIVAGFVCAVAALCYSELASMVPVSGSAYTYTYAVMGELMAWMVGWALILEYAVAASAVCVGWSGYVMGLVENATGFALPEFLSAGPAWSMNGFMPVADFTHGFINLPAIVVAAAVTWLLVIGTSESAMVNAVLVCIKIVALTAFIVLSLPMINGENFTPLMPNGLFGHDGLGVIGAAASIFFAYVGFDAVSTAAEETKNPQKNVPIGLIGSLAICTIFYLLVAAGVVGTVGAQPLMVNGIAISPDSAEFVTQCRALTEAGNAPIVCSKEALAEVLRKIGFEQIGNMVGLAASIALPSVILMMIYGQTRIFFVMARDGLLPEKLADVHPKFKTPWKVTIFTGIFVAIAGAFFPVGQLADISNSGTLFAFFMVAIAVLVLRKTDPTRHRPFKTPLVWIVAPLAIVGTVGLYLNLPMVAKLVLPIWGAIGLLIYFAYSRGHSHVGRGLIEVHEDDKDLPPPPGTT